MIHKLRRKFVLINMALVTLVLVIVFAVLCFSSYQRMEKESRDAMERVLLFGGNPPPKMELGNRKPDDFLSKVPVFWVVVDGEGTYLASGGDNVEVDEEMARTAAYAALAGGEDEGILWGMKLRYRAAESGSLKRIAFADMEDELESLASLIGTSLLVGLGGLAAFFIISLFLSNLALRPVQRAWEQQRQFVADASHELKTPLTVILANTGILMAHREDTVERQIKWVENTEEEAKRMKTLVDDMLFLAKSDAERPAEIRGTISLSDTVWSALLPFESVAYEEGVELVSDIGERVMCLGDESQLRQLTAILLDNALKYAGRGEKVWVKLRRDGERARLTVTNTGTEIAPEHLEHIFERFYREDSSRARAKGGYGLGLAIAKRIVDNHRGRIWAESGKGRTTFTVLI